MEWLNLYSLKIIIFNCYLIKYFSQVLLKTTVGDIDLELWSKEAPKACRNFIQLCLEGYYNGTIFHRVVKGFIVQGGDPTGTGTGGESIYGEPFKDEFHSRIRFNRRGLLAMANAGRNDNGSQFFFTLGATPELHNKHTIFGKVSGETIFNMIKLQEALVDQDERPLYPQKIVKTEVLFNPFPDIEPRGILKEAESNEEKKKIKDKSGVNPCYSDASTLTSQQNYQPYVQTVDSQIISLCLCLYADTARLLDVHYHNKAEVMYPCEARDLPVVEMPFKM
uniref:Peptidyl-prolyl cis-trans isomerase n=1 Tax=Timema cristinae TaxID=61476 RepID=A0A7R9GRN0_TIMCR|nr:unnamed protein product [Timema cristinae]